MNRKRAFTKKITEKSIETEALTSFEYASERNKFQT